MFCVFFRSLCRRRFSLPSRRHGTSTFNGRPVLGSALCFGSNFIPHCMYVIMLGMFMGSAFAPRYVVLHSRGGVTWFLLQLCRCMPDSRVMWDWLHPAIPLTLVDTQSLACAIPLAARGLQRIPYHYLIVVFLCAVGRVCECTFGVGASTDCNALCDVWYMQCRVNTDAVARTF